MSDLFTIDNLITLFLLILLQAVLGFDNLLYISLESKKAPTEKQAFVRKLGILIAIGLRIGLLLLLMSLIKSFQVAFINIDIKGTLSMHMNFHSLIVLLGGGFILYTAMKEIWHMIRLESDKKEVKKKSSVGRVITSIVIMNLVFSFDSILSAMALTDNFWVMAIAIVVSGLLMIWLSETVSKFLKKNRLYEVLGLFILFIVGIMLVTEGGHLAHIYLWDNPITPMSKTTFYFIIAILVLIDVVQSRYQKKLLKEKDLETFED